MLLNNHKTFVLHFALILSLLSGLFGVVPVEHVQAATLTVTNTNDSGAGSLRQAILDAASGDTIIFDAALAGQTITLASNLIINKNLTIDGSGLSPQVTLSGGNVAHLEIPGTLAPTVTISNLTISNGYSSDDGGAIYSTGRLTVVNSTLRNNYAAGGGGAIFSLSSLTLKNTTINQNQAGAGGAISIFGNGYATIVNSTIYQNQASDSGGAIFMYGNAFADIFNSTFAANTAAEGKELTLNGNSIVSLYNTVFVCAPPDDGNCYVEFGNSFISNNNSILGVGAATDFGLDQLADNGGPTQTMVCCQAVP